MKELIKSAFTAIGAMTTILFLIGLCYLALNKYNLVPEALSELRRDPVYQQQLSGNNPQIVNQVKVGDDVMPMYYQTWYNPQLDEYTSFIIKGE